MCQKETRKYTWTLPVAGICQHFSGAFGSSSVSFDTGGNIAKCSKLHPGQEAVPVNLQAFHDGEILSPLSFRFGGIGCFFSAVAYRPSLSCISLNFSFSAVAYQPSLPADPREGVSPPYRASVCHCDGDRDGHSFGEEFCTALFCAGLTM